MTKLRLLLLLAGAMLAGAIGFALGQGSPGSLVTSLQGNELVQIQGVQANGQPAPLINVVAASQLRNATGYQLLASASGTISPTNLVDNLLINAQPANGTVINTPSSPYDAELFAVCNVTSTAWATNTVTLSAASGSSLNAGTVTALTTLAAHTCEELTYDAANTTWYQVR